MPAPPPPPPMPPMGRGAGGPPPPPPMPGKKAPGGKPPSGAGRGALLTDIGKGARLKKVTQVNDRSAPIVGKVSDGPSGPPVGGAPPVPGMGRPPAPPSGLAPPVPGNRARSNSDTDRASGGMASGAPQLGGLFAGVGMPKLRKAGGVKTGAENGSPYLSDPETSRGSAPKPQPPRAAPAAPRPPPGAAPPIPGARPPAPPSVAALRSISRPSSIASFHSGSDIGSKPKPPPPVGKKPPIPPPASRKPSGLAPPPPPPPSKAPPVPGSAPPPPPPAPSHSPSAPPPPPPPSSSIPSAPPPPPPPGAAPGLPPSRSIPPPPPPGPPAAKVQQDDDDYDPYKYNNSTPSRAPSAPAPPPPKTPANGHAPSLAEQAARNAFGRTSPAAPPPPPPPPPSAAPSRPTTQAPVRSMLDSSSYTLSNGGSKAPTASAPASSGGQKARVVPIHDLRWRFQDEAQFPRPREFTAGPKRYRAGRGSSVPLDLAAYD